MQKLYAFALRLEAVLAGTFLLLMVALIFTGGVARMLHHPLNWTIDLATCFFAWAAFLCADIAWRRDALVAIDLLGERAPARLRQALAYANLVILTAFLGYVIYAGAVLSWVSRARSFQGIPEVSYSWVTMSLPVGGLLLLVTTLLKLRDRLRADGLVRGAPASPGGPSGRGG
ncbi:TRAP transporter small permease [Marinibaculum pumilum]|uniref:TRAP transporter small permease protein n=1 Tax=Marinibaculum pumilum TaxID=1766165 RepID=A0ABV7L788_9PROT